MAQPPLRQFDEASALYLGRQLCELSAHIQAAQAELALRLAAFDDDAGWRGAGIRSCCHWLSIQAGLDYHTSSDLLRAGHALAELPLIRDAFSAGQLSLDKVRALLRVATPDGVEIAPPKRPPLGPATGGAACLRRQHRERGLAIGPETPVASWGGESCDWRSVADVNADAACDARARAGHSGRSSRAYLSSTE